MDSPATTLAGLLADEELRRREFPVTRDRLFFAHAAVTALPRVAAEALSRYAQRGSTDSQESPWANEQIRGARTAAARLLDCSVDEIALLGPTTLGLNLVAHGLAWLPGDEVVYYPDDYPANVYPWAALTARGVVPVALAPPQPGVITWDLVEAALTERTRLVALASCHFLSGYRIDVDGIGRRLGERGVLFCVDGIQTLGAFPLSVEHVDFLSADSHKWLLGPSGAGIFYVKRERMEALSPVLLGALNVLSPDYLAQDTIRFHSGARRYESGTLNVPGIAGMRATMELLLDFGIEAIGARILALRRHLLESARPLGFQPCLEILEDDASNAWRSGIVSLTHPTRDLRALSQGLRDEACAVLSLRHDRIGRAFLRIAPHAYNTEEEIDRLVRAMA